MRLRIAVQQQQRRSAAAGHEIYVGAGGRDSAVFEAGEKIGHRTPLLLSVKAVDRLLEAGKAGNADPACGFTPCAIEA
jgi:hypothetical protein